MSKERRSDDNAEPYPVDNESFGVVAMAAYRPDDDLFRRQIESIRLQTHENFLCLISADGDSGELQSKLSHIVGNDPRFRLLGFEERLGFYGNFERVLKNVPAEAKWVALSDQDDYWYPNKIERLVTELGRYPLVASQARVVEYPSGAVVSPSTNRKFVRPQSYFVENQYTGGTMVFRRDVLDSALPFPRFDSPSEVHDHWIAVCASVKGPCLVIEDVLQDYVQHGKNVLGEAKPGFSPWRSYTNLLALSEKRRGSKSIGNLLETIYEVGAGWREIMADQLAERAPDLKGDIAAAVQIFGSGRKRWRTYWTISKGWRAGEITLRAALEYVVGDAAASLGKFIRRQAGTKGLQ